MTYFYGEDTYSARQALTELAHHHTAELVWLDRETLQSTQLATALGQTRSLFGRTLPVVCDPSLLARSQQTDLTTTLAQAEGPVVLWDRHQPDKRSLIWQTYHTTGTAFPAATLPQLVPWLCAEAQHRHVTLTAAAAAQLVQRVGTNRWRLHHELDRLSLLSADLTPTLIEQHTDAPLSGDLFALLDTISRQDAPRALRQLEELRLTGHSELQILAMLAYHIRLLLLIKAGRTAGHVPAAIARAGQVHPYAVQKNQPLAERLSTTILTDTLTRIMACDLAMKQGKGDPPLILHLLIERLSTSLRPSGAR